MPVRALPPAPDSSSPPGDGLHCARRQAERLISVRDRSEAELTERLIRAGFEADIVKQVVDEAVVVGLVDDERFVRLYVAGKKRSGWGRLRIERSLEGFGIGPGSRAGCLGDLLTDEEELERACACLEQYRPRAKDQDAARYRHLLSKGFNSQIAHRALQAHRQARHDLPAG
jgi:regulatory protein